MKKLINWFYSFRWSVLSKTIFFYAVLVLLVVTIVSFVTMSTFTNFLTKDAKRSAEDMTKQSYSSADILLSSTYNYFSRIFVNNTDIFNAMYSDEFGPLKSKSISDMLINLKASNPLIESIYIYNLSHDTVFSSESTRSLVETFFDQGMTDLLQQEGFLKQGLFIPRKAHITYKADPYEVDVITMVFSQARNTERADAALVVNLNAENLQHIIADGGRGDSRQSLILNKSGLLLSHSDSGKLSENLMKNGFIGEIQKSERNQGQTSANIDGKSYWIFYLKSVPLGLTFISTVEEQSVLSNVKTVQYFILGITSVFTMIAIVIAFFSIRRFYTPVRHIARKIGAAASAYSGPFPNNEYSLIETWFTYQENRVQELESSIAGYLDAGKKETLREILSGSFREVPENMKRLDKLDISLTAKAYAVCIVRIDNYQDIEEQFQTRDISLFKFGMMNIAKEVASENYRLELLDDSDDSFVMILNGDQEGLDMAFLISVLQGVQTNISKFLRMSVSISAGQPVNSIEQVNYSRNQAFLASKYRLVRGLGSLIMYEQEMSGHITAHEYPLSLEKQLTDSLKLGSKPKVATAAEAFFTEISSYHYEEIILYLSQVLMMTVRVSGVMTDHDELLHTELLSLADSLQQLDTLEQIRCQYVQICDRIMEFRDENSSGRIIRIVEKVKELVHSNYTNPELTIDEIARQVGMSKNHLRKIFSDQCGDTISQYLSDYRFGKAKELLIQTDYPAAKISEMVGIANSNYFYSSFKKHVGKSPVHYRGEHKLN
ncbi:AraC family transcriptional regulator [Paenibacillus odorifer]|uniref:AraC family transcriptional regulator n=1 Tax=Paenibacillus odorifer TaxID=189426 RepID=UPI0020C9DB3C|nr:helix-turn-helix domain-containing protein [Paenibacillus odorifer]